MSKLRKIELFCHAVIVSLLTLLYVVLGLVLLFGPTETRLARTSGTLIPAFGWAIATWFLYCALFTVLCRIVFAGLGFVLRKRGTPNHTIDENGEQALPVRK